MARYRKKPVVVEAYKTDKELIIQTLEGDMKANVGDYIITGVKGEQYPCKPDIFEATYESADTTANVAPIADTVREMQERLKQYIDVGHYRSPTEICFSELDVANIIDKIAQEMLECKDER